MRLAVVLSKIIGCFRSLRPNAFLLITVVAALCWPFLSVCDIRIPVHRCVRCLDSFIGYTTWPLCCQLCLAVVASGCGVVVIGVPTAWIVLRLSGFRGDRSFRGCYCYQWLTLPIFLLTLTLAFSIFLVQS